MVKPGENNLLQDTLRAFLRKLVLRIISFLLKRDFRVKEKIFQTYFSANIRAGIGLVRPWRARPLFSILIPTYNSDPEILKKCLDSVLAQVYTKWQLCIVDDGSVTPEVRPLLEEYARQDPRITLKFSKKNAGIAATINKAAQLAQGEFVGVLDHDDELHPMALCEFFRVVNKDPATDCIYCDEDKIDTNGNYCFPWFKSDWNPDLLLSFNYIMHFVLCRRSLYNEIGGVRKAYEGSQDYDFILRVAEKTEKIVHIPQILYHWRMGPGSIATDPSAKPGVFISGIAALTDTLKRRNIKGVALDAPDAWQGVYRVRRDISPHVSCSILVFSRGNEIGLHRLLTSIQKSVASVKAEIIICTAAPLTVKKAAACCAEIPVHLVPTDDNIARAFNKGVQQANSDTLLFLDDEMELAAADSLTGLLEQIQRTEVGAVGGKVYYENGLVEHAGVILGCLGLVGYAHRATPDDPGYAGLKSMIGNYSAVMGLGMMTRKKNYIAVGGFDENFAGAYWDVDYCLKLRQKNFLITYTPYAQFVHHIAVQAVHEMRVEPEASRLRQNWQGVIDHDPYFNRNFSREREDFSINGGE